MARTFTVAYCVDHAMALPQRVSAVALLEHLDPEVTLDLHVIYRDLPERDRERLRRSLDRLHRSFHLTFHEADLTLVEGFPKLSGSYLPYALLLMPKRIRAERFVYLDADTLPLCDVSKLDFMELNGAVLAGAAWHTAQAVREWPFLRMQGLPASTPIFNTGVLVVDAVAWNEGRVTERCLQVGREHADDYSFVSHDETLLNTVLAGDFVPLPWMFNVRCGMRNRVRVQEGFIAHFVGSVKPWDLGAQFVHRNYELWRAYTRKTGEPVYQFDMRKAVHHAQTALRRFRQRTTQRLVPT